MRRQRQLSVRGVHGPARLVRGWLAAFLITLLAAASHTIADTAHQIDPLVWLLSFSLAGLVCTGLAGRTLSPWRTSVAVLASQTIFHGLFSLTHGSHHGTLAVSSSSHVHAGHQHVDHISVVVGGDAQAVSAHSDTGMVAAHIVAALASVWLIQHGEHAIYRVLDRLVVPESRRILTALTPSPVSVRPLPVINIEPIRSWGLMLARARSVRGPPRVVAAAG